ncbi:MAG: nitroreductase, partial [Alphaproteobacteria bacterium]
FFVFREAARAALGRVIRDAYLAEEPNPSKAVARSLAALPCEAPVLVILASTPSDAKPIPEWEQRLSAGAAGMAMLTAAHLLGFVGQWLTGWPAYSPGVARHLGLDGADRIAGFLFFGSAGRVPSERPRPEPDLVVRHFRTESDVLD